MALNEELLADNSILDGVKFTIPYNGYDQYQQRVDNLCKQLAEASGWNEMDVRKYVKFARVKSGRKDGTELETYFIGGKLAKYVPDSWTEGRIRNCTEVQMKFYLVEGKGLGYGALIDAIWASDRGKFSSSFTGPNSGNGRGEPGKRGFAFSTAKSDVHVRGNQYRGLRPHVEGHVKGRILRKIIDDASQREERAASSGTARKAFQEVQYQAALRTARRFLRSIRSRGIRLTDFIEGVSNISWEKPIHDVTYDVLDAEEERLLAKYANVPGMHVGDQQQMTLFRDEDYSEE